MKMMELHLKRLIEMQCRLVLTAESDNAVHELASVLESSVSLVQVCRLRHSCAERAHCQKRLSSSPGHHFDLVVYHELQHHLDLEKSWMPEGGAVLVLLTGLVGCLLQQQQVGAGLVQLQALACLFDCDSVDCSYSGLLMMQLQNQQ